MEKENKSPSFKEVQDCLNSIAWKNFSILELSGNVSISRRKLTEANYSVSDIKTTRYILTFLKKYCLDAKQYHYTVDELLLRLKEDTSPSISGFLKETPSEAEKRDAQLRVFHEIKRCFVGDKEMYHNMLWG